MNRRLQLFDNLESHAWLGRLWKRLSPQDLEIARRFCIDNEALGVGDFESKLVRLWLDQPDSAKPKGHQIIRELLLCANSQLFAEQQKERR